MGSNKKKTNPAFFSNSYRKESYDLSAFNLANCGMAVTAKLRSGISINSNNLLGTLNMATPALPKKLLPIMKVSELRNRFAPINVPIENLPK